MYFKFDFDCVVFCSIKDKVIDFVEVEEKKKFLVIFVVLFYNLFVIYKELSCEVRL